MAKITDFKFEINKKEFIVHVNCNSGGQFTANLPEQVYEALDLKNKLTFNSFEELRKEFYSAIDRYKKAQTSEELFILIKYLSSGTYSQKKDGSGLFNGYNNKYQLNISFSSNSISAIAFEFKVCIKETIDGVENWHETQQGKKFPHWEIEENNNPEKYYKRSKAHNHNDWKKIPFSEIALTSLTNAQEKIRSASEALFNFIEQDEETIELTLTKTALHFAKDGAKWYNAYRDLKEDSKDLLAALKELLHVHEDATYGDLVWRLAVKEQAEKLITNLEPKLFHT